MFGGKHVTGDLLVWWLSFEHLQIFLCQFIDGWGEGFYSWTETWVSKGVFSHENKSVFDFAAVTVLHLQFAGAGCKTIKFLVGWCGAVSSVWIWTLVRSNSNLKSSFGHQQQTFFVGPMCLWHVLVLWHVPRWRVSAPSPWQSPGLNTTCSVCRSDTTAAQARPSPCLLIGREPIRIAETSSVIYAAIVSILSSFFLFIFFFC